MKILMFGKTGQVATEIQRRAQDVTALGRDQADLIEPEACRAAVLAAEADLVLNAAAYTAVDQAEEDEATAFKVNAAAPTAMAEAAALRGLPFLHISTDYVFDGSGDTPWVEDAPTAPLGAYGRTKLAGEQGIVAAGGAHVILRTAWVHAAHGGNFLRTMLRLADRERLTIVDDQRGGPTAAGDIAEALLTIARAFHEGRGTNGIYHFCGAPAVSWHGFASEIFAMSQGPSPDCVPVPSSEYPTKAARPGNSVLECSKIALDYGIAQPDWRVSLREILTEIEGET
ncbi:MAG: dTDP-4-dehydrorhamnose reductase [Pseudomonadota bacterium]